jgi:type II restriction enzyme
MWDGANFFAFRGAVQWIPNMEKTQSLKERLDRFLNKQRVAMYKPIQVAEILYRVRLGLDGMNLDQIDNVEVYRNPSKHWRDTVSKMLIGQVSTSSQKFQDNLFEENAVPPSLLKQLAEVNNQFNGVVERYIYQRFALRQKAIRRVYDYVKRVREASLDQFDLTRFLSLFRAESGLRRSIDKAYELVVYALFSALLQQLRVKVQVSVDMAQSRLLEEFGDFTRVVLGIDSQVPLREFHAGIYRAGVTNAADRGLDLWANFGPAVQVKHISLSEEIAEDIANEVRADEIVIVCKDAEAEVVRQVCEQLGQRLRGIVRESDLVSWYQRALSPTWRNSLGKALIDSLHRELQLEFPFSETFEPFYKERGYDRIPKPDEPCAFWEADHWAENS